MIPDMIREWESRHSMVLGIKRSSEEKPAHVLGSQEVLTAW